MAPDQPPPQLRAADADRWAAVEGRLDAEELEERLAVAYSAKWVGELDGLTADVTPPVPAPADASASASTAWRYWPE